MSHLHVIVYMYYTPSLFIHILSLFIGECLQNGWTALHYAESGGVVEALVAAGADVTAVENVRRYA